MRQMAQDIELARNSARMLTEAVSFADPEMEAIEENELIKVRGSGLLCQSLWTWSFVRAPTNVIGETLPLAGVPFQLPETSAWNSAILV